VVLGEGLVLLGCVRMWQRRDLPAGFLVLGGCAIVMATRSYAGGVLLMAAGGVTLHAALRRTESHGTRAPRLAVTVAAIGALALAFAAFYSSPILAKLQQEQDTYTSDTSNLALEPVNFSSVSAVAVNLPRRVRDLVVRPYPWQASNMSQRLGVVGALVCWGLLAIVIAFALLDWRGLCRRAGPVLYLAVAVMLCYSLTTANAGTGFRYRTHLVAFLAATTAAAIAPRWPSLAGRIPRLRVLRGARKDSS